MKLRPQEKSTKQAPPLRANAAPAANPLPTTRPWEALYGGLFGLWLGLALLKFGNPVVLAHKIETPSDLLQFLINPWPLAWGSLLMLPLMAVALFHRQWPRGAPVWVLALPAVWFAFQVVAAGHSIDSAMSTRTVVHFLSVVVAFYLGLVVFAGLREVHWFWALLLGAFSLVLLIGWHQHFIGLEETRRYFEVYERPKFTNGPPPELLQKLASNRIYSTLFYPNTLAAVVLMMSPLLLTKIYLLEGITRPAKRVLLAIASLGAVMCLLWSGSKAGWLIALVMLAVGLLRFPAPRRLKLTAVSVLCVVGIGLFLWRNSAYLEKGATSATARLDYWRAAVRALSEQPIHGYGPGTFKKTYERLKPVKAEMSWLTHNDYLEQASDSGFPGFLTYSLFIGASIWLLYRKSLSNPLQFAGWVSILGMALHGLVEFNLYVPAVAWPQFFLLGWLWGRSGQVPASPASCGLGDLANSAD